MSWDIYGFAVVHERERPLGKEDVSLKRKNWKFYDYQDIPNSVVVW